MQALGEGLGEPVRQRLGHDGVVVVMFRFELRDEFRQTDARSSQQTHRGGLNVGGFVIRRNGLQIRPTFRRDEIRERMVRFAVFLLHLLPEKMK